MSSHQHSLSSLGGDNGDRKLRELLQDGDRKSVLDEDTHRDIVKTTNVAHNFARVSDHGQSLSWFPLGESRSTELVENGSTNLCQTSGKHQPLDAATQIYHVGGESSPQVPAGHAWGTEEASGHDIYFDMTSGFDRYTNYAPIIVNRHLECTKQRDFTHEVNKLGSQLNVPGWSHELSQENDINLRNYLEYGVTHGFLIVDEAGDVCPYERSNYSSALQGDAFQAIDKIVHDELSKGKYRISKDKPFCVHSVGAVPKKGGKWRPITDCKRPEGASINSHMESTYHPFCFTSVDNVIEMIQPDDYMASVDIQNAYRSIMVHPSQWCYQGIRWPINGVDTYLLDTHICFGLKCAPYLFTQVSNFVLRCLHRRGFVRSSVYLDDFLVVGKSKEECLNAQNCLIEILRSLGFGIS